MNIEKKLNVAGIMAWVFALIADIVIKKYYTLGYFYVALILFPWFCCIIYVAKNCRKNFLRYAWVYLSVVLAMMELLLRVILYLSWKNGFAP